MSAMLKVMLVALNLKWCRLPEPFSFIIRCTIFVKFRIRENRIQSVGLQFSLSYNARVALCLFGMRS